MVLLELMVFKVLLEPLVLLVVSFSMLAWLNPQQLKM
jgi:hypothetical protein